LEIRSKKLSGPNPDLFEIRLLLAEALDEQAKQAPADDKRAQAKRAQAENERLKAKPLEEEFQKQVAAETARNDKT
jgi:hypothetical protein